MDPLAADVTATTQIPPVLLLAFNRPETTARVVESLRAVRPARVFMAVDGPREGREAERHLVAEVRRLADRLDWGCEVRTLLRDANLGCKRAVSEAISWFFEHVDAGVILEDDCVAHPSFFPFAGELLERYRADERVFMISGDNFQFGRRRTAYSYYFSRYTHIWGWASWRRAWRRYDHAMSLWPQLRDGGWLQDLLGDPAAVAYWTRIFDATHGEQNTSWAYRWTFAVWAQGGLSVVPNVNLVSNIGFGHAATHTIRRGSRLAALPTGEMTFPLRHPPFMIRDARADSLTQRSVFGSGSVLRRIAGAVWRRLPRGE